MILVLVGLLVVVALFCFVVLFGAPYLPTFRRQAEQALDMLELKKGQTLYELGCGDGKVLLLAAQRGYKVVGYELNPILAAVSWLRTRRYGRQVRVVWGNFWWADLSPADGIFVFLLHRYMKKLDKKLIKINKPLRLVSYAFKIPDKKPAIVKKGLYRYDY